MNRQETAQIIIFKNGHGVARFNGRKHVGVMIAELESWAYDQGAIFAQVRPHGKPTYTRRLGR